MSALPAESYAASPTPRVPLRHDADVVRLADRRSDAHTTPPPPEQNSPKTPQNVTTSSDPSSGAGITIREIPGDWSSVSAVWTGTPEPLSALVGQVQRAREADDARDVAMACWALLVAAPRGVLHLASWALEHPLRTAAVTLLLTVLIATLTH